MALSNCTDCGKIFSRTERPTCPECARKEEDLLLQATEWLRDNQGQTITSMSEALGISSRLILEWVRQKRITLSDKSDGIPCKRCGELVFSGLLCNRCKIALSHDFQQGLKVIKESEPLSACEEEKKGMHYTREDRENRLRF